MHQIDTTALILYYEDGNSELIPGENKDACILKTDHRDDPQVNRVEIPSIPLE